MQKVKDIFSGDKDRTSTGSTGGNSLSSENYATGDQTNSRNSVGGGRSSLDRSSAGTGATTGATGTTGATSTGTTGSSSGKHSLLQKIEDKHEVGHSRTRGETDPTSGDITHDTKHLGEIVHEKQHHHTTQEVERQREHERHIHHVQHHVQPIKDEKIIPDIHHEKIVPKTHIRENHSSSDQDRTAFSELGKQYEQGSVSHQDGRHRVVDLGETVNEHVHHHVHNVVQPVIHQDTHEHHKHHVVIPTHHVTHEAPIVHQSNKREMLSREDFLAGGGQLGSSLHHNDAGVLANGNCEREVDGVGERMAKELGIGSLVGSGSTSHGPSGQGSTGLSGTKVDQGSSGQSGDYYGSSGTDSGSKLTGGNSSTVGSQNQSGTTSGLRGAEAEARRL